MTKQQLIDKITAAEDGEFSPIKDIVFIMDESAVERGIESKIDVKNKNGSTIGFLHGEKLEDFHMMESQSLKEFGKYVNTVSAIAQYLGVDIKLDGGYEAHVVRDTDDKLRETNAVLQKELGEVRESFQRAQGAIEVYRGIHNKNSVILTDNDFGVTG